MKKQKTNKLFYLLLVVIFAVLAVYVRLDNVYDEALKGEVYEIFPSRGDGSYTVKNLEENISFEKRTSRIIVSLKPGEEYSSHLLLKNHAKVEKGFKMVALGGFSYENPDNPIEVSFEEEDLVFAPSEWKILSYTIKVPEDVEEGDYTGTLAFTSADIHKNSEGMDMAFGVGVDVELEVREEPLDYDYELLLDLDQTPNNLALEYVYKDAKKLLGYGFALMAIIFFVMAILDELKKKKKKK